MNFDGFALILQGVPLRISFDFDEFEHKTYQIRPKVWQIRPQTCQIRPPGLGICRHDLVRFRDSWV